MKRSKLAFFTIAISITIAGSALADTANSNPDPYYLYSTADSKWYMGSSSDVWAFGNAPGATPAYLDTYVDGTGSVSWNGTAGNFSSQEVGTTGYFATFQPSNVTGAVDFFTGTTFHYTFTAQLSFSGNGITGGCKTPSFTVTVDVASSAGSWTPAGSNYDSSTGNYRAVNASFYPPAVTTGCGSAANRSALNSALSLGSSLGGNHHEIVWYGKAIDENTNNPGTGSP
jgi:hypothetical protein